LRGGKFAHSKISRRSQKGIFSEWGGCGVWWGGVGGGVGWCRSTEGGAGILPMGDNGGANGKKGDCGSFISREGPAPRGKGLLEGGLGGVSTGVIKGERSREGERGGVVHLLRRKLSHFRKTGG